MSYQMSQDWRWTGAAKSESVEFSKRPGPPGAGARILMIDDQPLFGEGLWEILKDRPGLDGLIETSSVGEALRRLELAPICLVIVDLFLPIGEGLALIRQIRESGKPILIMSRSGEATWVLGAMEAGAVGFILKTASRQDVRTAVIEVLAGRSYIHSPIAHHFIDRIRATPVRAMEPSTVSITAREQAILELVAGGANTSDICSVLHLASSTVKSHMRALFYKFSVSTRTQLVLKALQIKPSLPADIASLPDDDAPAAMATPVPLHRDPLRSRPLVGSFDGPSRRAG